MQLRDSAFGVLISFCAHRERDRNPVIWATRDAETTDGISIVFLIYCDQFYYISSRNLAGI